MAPCWCNRCKGQKSFHRNTITKHLGRFGQHNATGVPSVGEWVIQQTGTTSGGSVPAPNVALSNAGVQEADSSSSSSSSSGEDAPLLEHASQAKRARTVSPEPPVTDRENRGPPLREESPSDAQEHFDAPPSPVEEPLGEPEGRQEQVSASPNVSQPRRLASVAGTSAAVFTPDQNDEPQLEQLQQAAHDLVNAAALDQDTTPPQQPFTGEQTLVEDDEPTPSMIDHVQTTQEYIKLIQEATLENGKLPEDVIHNLRSPAHPDVNFSDEDVRLCLAIYVAASRSSEAIYTSVIDAINHRWPPSEDGQPQVETLSIHNVRKAVETIAGVHPILDDMCVNSCIAFTGPFSDEEKCPKCSEDRYVRTAGTRGSVKRSPRKRMTTIPLGPQLAALRRSKEYASDMRYRHKETQKVLAKLELSSTSSRSSDSELSDNSEFVYNDITCGSDYLELVQQQKITEKDTMVTFSFDGAQLYRNKDSDTWLAVWIVNDYSPKLRYKRKHILPAFVVPGPKKPKLLDSYTFRSFHHLSSIQREDDGRGIKMWDALEGNTGGIIQSRIFLHLVTADAVALTEMDGRVGHHGRHGCRIGCPMPGRYKPGSGGHYYAVHSLPDDYSGRGAQHPDVDIRKLEEPSEDVYQKELETVIKSKHQTEYAENRKATGLSKPSILSGLHPNRVLPIPKCFSVDVMHLIFINAGELLVPLWRGVSKLKDPNDSFDDWPWVCLKEAKAWKAHGQLVADARQFFPSSFHRPPRNPAEKINSGYKATEYYLYIFGLGPGFFRPLLPPLYWRNLCQLVRGVRIILQRSIREDQLTEAYKCFIQFVEDFEAIYYKRKVSRMHFCRPWIHTLLHLASETARIGPGAYYSQFTMERAIGDYGRDIRQPSNPFGNLAKIIERHAQLNAFYATYPDMAPPKTTSGTASDLPVGGGYVLLHPTCEGGIARVIPGAHGDFLLAQHGPGMNKVYWWGRLQLPNGQIIRSAYREKKLIAGTPRIARNAKINYEGVTRYAEIQFYFRHRPNTDAQWKPKALAALYSEPVADLLRESHGTLYACHHTGTTQLAIIDVSDIQSLVSMQPLPPCAGDPPNLVFAVEKSGLEDADIIGSGPGDE